MRTLVHRLAEHFPAPVGGKRVGSAGIYSIDGYIYMFVLEDGIDAAVPEDGTDEAAAASDAGYIGSSKYIYYLSKGNNTESS